MCKCETCLWDCGAEETIGECEFYYEINESETFEDEYIDDLKLLFSVEWEEYVREWN